MAAPDELFTLKNLFYLGSYQAAINEGSTVRIGADLHAERDTYVYRSYIALGQADVALDEIPDDVDHFGLQAVRMLASYVKDTSSRTALMLQLGEWCSDGSHAADPLFAVAAASLFMQQKDYGEALRVLHSHASLEAGAMQVQCLISLDRLDLAAKQVKALQSLDDDATLAQLAAAWLYVAQGGDKYAEASYIYQELVEKFGPTLMLLNGQGVCNLHLRRFEVAEKHFIDAIGMGANDPDTLVNLITCSRHLGKPSEFVERYVSQLRRAAPEHPYVADLDKVSAMFDRVAASMDVA